MGAIEKKVDELEKLYEKRLEEKDINDDNERKSAFEILKENNLDEIEGKSVKQTAFEEGINQLFSNENLQMKTELSAPLILAMSRGRIYAEHYHSKYMNDFIDNIQILSVSKGRKGRQELVSLVRNSQDIEELDSGMTSIAKMMGTRGN